MKIAIGFVGVVVGIGIGWLLFGGALDPEPAPDRGSSERTSSRDSGAPVVDETGETVVPTGPADDAETIRSGSLEDLWTIVNENGRDYTDAEVAALIERLDGAHRDRLSKPFRAALRGLGRAGTPAAERMLLQVLADESIPLHGSWGMEFLPALLECDLPEIAPAARRRFELNLAAGQNSWVAGTGYFDLVARHGTETDLDWLLARTESSQVRGVALRALAKSPKPGAIDRALNGLETDARSTERTLRALAEASPERAHAVLAEVIRDGTIPGRPDDRGGVFRLYGQTVPAEGIEEAVRLLTGLRDPMDRMAAIYAVEAMRRRGLGMSGFGALLEEPVRTLESVAGEEDLRAASKARYAVEYNRVLWSERAARALEHAGRTLPPSSTARNIAAVAEKVRAGLDAYWRDQ